MDATDANVFTFIYNMTCCGSQQIHKEAMRTMKTRRKGVHFKWLSLSLDPLYSQLFSIFTE